MSSDDKLVHIACRVPPIVAQRLGKMAQAASMQTGPYATQLLLAAYSARAKPPTGDRDLDTAVARVVVLWAEKRNTANLAEAVGLSEPTVIRIIDAWRAEVSFGRKH